MKIYPHDLEEIYKHQTKAGRVTIAGHPGDDLSERTLNSILKQSQLKRVK